MPKLALFLCQSLLCPGHLQVRDILYHFLNIVHGVGNRLFVICIHNLLHALGQLCLQVRGIKPIGRGLDLWHFLPDSVFRLCRFFLPDPSPGSFLPFKLAVLFLLLLIQRLVKQLHFQRLLHIFPIPKPQHKFITGRHTPIPVTYAMVQICQLKYPFFPKLPFLELLQNLNLC